MLELNLTLCLVVMLTVLVVYLLWKVHSLEDQVWKSPQVEHYTRASVVIGRIQVDAGLEYRDDDPPIVGHDLWQLCKEVTQRAHWMAPMDALRSAESTIGKTWPGRAWFLEIGDPEGTAYSQSYLPYGKPRWRYDEPRRWWQIWKSDDRKAA